LRYLKKKQLLIKNYRILSKIVKMGRHKFQTRKRRDKKRKEEKNE
jgi:hypothetical protein